MTTAEALKAVSDLRNSPHLRPPSPIPFKERRRRCLEALRDENVALNNREWAEKRIILTSTPQVVFLQINAVCNADCVFCSKGYDYPIFDIDEYFGKYGTSVLPVLRRARELILTGSGEFLGLPKASRILEHFNRQLPHVDKYVATNASHLKPELLDLIVAGESRYTLQLSLHAADRETFEKMMRYKAYDRVMGNIRSLMEKRDPAKTRVYCMFVMTTLNAESLPDFIRFARDLGADRVIAGYFYIYEAQQKYLSLYFKQDLANRVIAEARKVADELKMDVSLPHPFGLKEEGAPRAGSCIEPWHQIMFNPDGGVLPCDVYGGFRETLNEKTFQEIWNGPSYRSIRRALKTGGGCLTTCPRHNPIGVNDWRAHVIHRHKDDKQIVKEYHEALKKP